MTFRERFDDLVSELRSHPKVEVYLVDLGPPVSSWEVEAVEKGLGQPLPADLLAFYRAHNGAFLEWGLKNTVLDYEHTPSFSRPSYRAPPGCINLLDASSALSRTWADDFSVNAVSPELQVRLFGKIVEPKPPFGAAVIDDFSKYHHGDLVIGPEPVMIVSSDHGAELEESDFMSFSTYLDLTLALFGTNRYDAVGHVLLGGTRKRLDRWTESPTLDGVIAKVEASESSL
jgi:hypothetical protein